MENNEEKTKNNEKESFSVKLKNYIKNLFDFSEFGIKDILFIAIFIFLIIISGVILYYNYFVNTTFLYRIVIEWFVNPIFLLGIIGIFLFIGIMALQGLIIPIPSEVVLLAAGMIWGWFAGGIMGIIGSLAAGVLCFYISRRGGRPLAEKFGGKSAINMADDFIHKYGMSAILVARFLPFIAFDPISYASGLVDMDVKRYSLATFLGSIPRAFFYSLLGASLGIIPPITFDELPYEQIEAQAALFNNVLLIIGAVLVGIFLLYIISGKLYEKRRGK